MRHLIGRTRNDVAVYVDLVDSPAAVHIADQPRLLSLVKEVLERTHAKAAQIRLEQDMGRTIGYSFVVETSDSDVIVYAQLPRDGDAYARFVKNGKPTATKYLTVIMQRAEDGSYELRDTWVGRLSPPRPGSDSETTESKSFWANHAYVLDRQPMRLRTLTKVCPY